MNRIQTTILLLCLGVLPHSAKADTGAPRFDTGNSDYGAMTQNARPKVLDNVGIDQHLDAQLPLDTPLTDESGRLVKLSDYLGVRPVLLQFVQFSCRNLCTLELNGLCRSLNACGRTGFMPGTDYDILTISFDTRETAADARGKKQMYVSQINIASAERVAGAWHFLTGSPDAIKRLTDTAGFRFVYDARNDQFIHSGAMMIITPDGHLSKYLYGAEYRPNDVRLAVADASANGIGSVSDSFLLYCFHYDPATGRYTLAIRNLLRAGGVLTLAGVAGFIGVQIRRERRQNAGRSVA